MVTPIGPISPGVAASLPTAPTRTTGAAAGDFGEMVGDALRSVSQMEHRADAMVQDVATGGDTRIEDVMVATAQAQLGIELVAQVRDRALAAYQEIMRLPL